MYLSSLLLFTAGYDPLTHGGYGAVDDYAPYPHLVTSASPDYSRNASRQDYNPDKCRRRDHHLGKIFHHIGVRHILIVPPRCLNTYKTVSDSG